PLFAGVYWDVQDVMMEDVDRVEIIRGPGAAVWGANAVNGVINIITKEAANTQGFLASAGGGSENLASAAVRYGGTVGENGHYRIYSKLDYKDASELASGLDAQDESEMFRGGFRIDLHPADGEQFTFQGDIYGGEGERQATIPSLTSPTFNSQTMTDSNLGGGNLVARWSKELSEASNYSVQFFYDRTTRDEIFADQTIDIYDLDFDHTFVPVDNHSLTWGLGYRIVSDDLKPGENGSFREESRDLHLFSSFVQDEYEILEKTLSLILGTKLEHNDYTGVEIQPTARLVYTPDTANTLWASFSRAVRTPSRADSDIVLPVVAFPTDQGLPGLASIEGSNDFDSEKLLAYEIGYRTQVTESFLVDLSTFYFDYTDLRAVRTGMPTPNFMSPIPHIDIISTVSNQDTLYSYGGELLLDWRASDSIRFQASYSYIYYTASVLNPLSDAGIDFVFEGGVPEHQATFRSQFDLTKTVELDSAIRYVDRLIDMDVASYVELDLRLGWHITEDLELSIIGKNLLDDKHPEYSGLGLGVPSSEIERSVYGKITYRLPNS
ncbi:MAG: TonB-dependent receptor, partial [Bdellovibrionales bacterium]|nr:TonB-dependent receptor [Bdellovibrionales bacterium]